MTLWKPRNREWNGGYEERFLIVSARHLRDANAFRRGRPALLRPPLAKSFDCHNGVRSLVGQVMQQTPMYVPALGPMCLSVAAIGAITGRGIAAALTSQFRIRALNCAMSVSTQF